MTDRELEQRLKAARPPALDPDYSENFPRAVLAQARLGQRGQSVATSRVLRWNWAVGMALACIALVCVIDYYGRGRAPRETESMKGVLENPKLIREAWQMFPNQVRAIVQDGPGLRLVLSDQPDLATSPPIYVHICDGKQCLSLVTFSGQEIQVAGTTITVLCGPGGSIIVEGSRFAWTTGEKVDASAQNIKVDAKILGPVTM